MPCACDDVVETVFRPLIDFEENPESRRAYTAALWAFKDEHERHSEDGTPLLPSGVVDLFEREAGWRYESLTD